MKAIAGTTETAGSSGQVFLWRTTTGGFWDLDGAIAQ